MDAGVGNVLYHFARKMFLQQLDSVPQGLKPILRSRASLLGLRRVFCFLALAKLTRLLKQAGGQLKLLSQEDYAKSELKHANVNKFVFVTGFKVLGVNADACATTTIFPPTSDNSLFPVRSLYIIGLEFFTLAFETIENVDGNALAQEG